MTTFTRKEEKALAYLAREAMGGKRDASAEAALLKGAARRAGVRLEVVQQWFADPAFKAALEERVMAWYDATCNEAEAGYARAVDKLIFILLSETDNPRMRLRAIQTARYTVAKVGALDRLDLDGIEGRIGEQGQNQRSRRAGNEQRM